ncbi:MAG: Asp-tRNA(Asn)/Glu-tRNA(Gln) amidotransferase subunit GatA, partial [Ignavibacteriales bacterium]|nr:Asp-tRNA(Asn)/Glu-tRNA(Gln) amidotransferase subunit GatA [Ignavibacteriales bacterium]
MNIRESYDSYRTRLLRDGESCEQRVHAHLDVIKQRSNLNAFLSVFEEESLRSAQSVDAKIKSGNARPLAGMIIAVKDVLCLKGKKTT